MGRTWVAFAIVTAVSCSRSASDVDKTGPAAAPPAPPRSSTSVSPGAAAPAVDICAMEAVVVAAFGEPFRAGVAGTAMACDFDGPAPGEIVGVHANHGSRAHVDGFKSMEAARPVEGVGEVAYFVDLA